MLAIEPHDDAFFWATNQRAEIDPILSRKGPIFGVECKCADAPRITLSIEKALVDSSLAKVAVHYPSIQRFNFSDSSKLLRRRRCAAAIGCFRWMPHATDLIPSLVLCPLVCVANLRRSWLKYSRIPAGLGKSRTSPEFDGLSVVATHCFFAPEFNWELRRRLGARHYSQCLRQYAQWRLGVAANPNGPEICFNQSAVKNFRAVAVKSEGLTYSRPASRFARIPAQILNCTRRMVSAETGRVSCFASQSAANYGSANRGSQNASSRTSIEDRIRITPRARVAREPVRSATTATDPCPSSKSAALNHTTFSDKIWRKST